MTYCVKKDSEVLSKVNGKLAQWVSLIGQGVQREGADPFPDICHLWTKMEA